MTRATPCYFHSALAYLVLLQMEVTAFHRNLIRSSLWPYSAPYTVASFQRTAVSRHLALCSPDFPPSLQGDRNDRKGHYQFTKAVNCQVKCEGLTQFAMPVNWQAKCDGDCLASFSNILTPNKRSACPQTQNISTLVLCFI